MKLSDNTYLLAEMREYRSAFAGLLFFSFIITVLFLVPSLFMQQVFERVMQSRNISTLIALSTIVVFLTAIWTILEVIRSKILQRISFSLDEKISARVFDGLNRQTDTLPAASRGVILQDLNTLRDFLTGYLIVQFLDACWVPVIILAGFMFHPILGLALLAVTALVATLAYFSQKFAQDDIKHSLVVSSQAADIGRSIMQSAETTRVMGMLPSLVERWRVKQREMIGWQQHASTRSALFVNALRFIRHLYFPLMLVVGVLLFLSEQVGAGIIFGACILVGRTVAPVDAIANSWRALWNLRMSVERINMMLEQASKRAPKVSLPRPEGALMVSRVAAAPRNRDQAVLTDISFSVEPGRVVGVVGASGAGKSSLARVLVGAWSPLRGSISLDGHDISHWDQDELGRHIGYVPQDVELLSGTVAENIARFEPRGPDTDSKVVAAVRLAGVQDIIVKLPEGLNTRLGPDGHTLSSGQRQRIALARAVYGSPRFVVLDEPNSNLDAAGEQQLAQTIAKLTQDNAIVILVTHRMNMLSICHHVLVMNSGTVQTFGERDQVLDRLSNYRPKALTSGASSGPGSPVAA
jgi:PrtD family type I secretion system ABC transporter